MHRKVVTGCHRNKVKQFQRKKDSEQLCEDEESEIQENAPRHEHVKMPVEVRLLLGVTVVQLQSGEIIGRCCKAYDYTGKTVCSKRDMKEYEREEIHCVKNLKEGRGG
eukprot:5867922-Ditylum_brightwellii.AAC.1